MHCSSRDSERKYFLIGGRKPTNPQTTHWLLNPLEWLSEGLLSKCVNSKHHPIQIKPPKSSWSKFYIQRGELHLLTPGFPGAFWLILTIEWGLSTHNVRIQSLPKWHENWCITPSWRMWSEFMWDIARTESETTRWWNLIAHPGMCSTGVSRSLEVKANSRWWFDI